jgi:hypothetical protein
MQAIEFGRFIQSEHAKYSRLIKDLDIQAD